MGLTLKDVDKVVGQEIYLEDINLHLKPGSRNVILGRTLAGKTTLLRIMAGLDRPSRGQVIVNGKDVTGQFVRNRNVAMVYQQFINYPSLSVYNNIASPLKLAGYNKKEIDRRVNETARMLHLEEMLDRIPAELSGGQQQRIAIARALAKDADLLLLDEPLVNLDYKLREELREELQDIFKKREAIVVYTTTEPTEALMLGGNIVVMNEGRILQTGPTPDVYHNPDTLKVAEVFSDPPINFMNGTIGENCIHLGTEIACQNGCFQKLPDDNYIVGVRSNHLSLSRKDDNDIESHAEVELTEINGSETFIHLHHNDSKLVVQEHGIISRKTGEDVSVYVNPQRFFIYNEDGELVASPTSGIIEERLK